jgi:hypothetical protein
MRLWEARAKRFADLGLGGAAHVEQPLAVKSKDSRNGRLRALQIFGKN